MAPMIWFMTIPSRAGTESFQHAGENCNCEESSDLRIKNCPTTWLGFSPESFRRWARQDSNLGPRDYESPALTAELQAHLNYRVKHNTSLVTNPESIRDCSNSEFFASKPLSYRPTAPLRGERLT